ncbi:lysozyme inhibitor LprI family protein [Burkholderia lata]|uniref:lysozyme inhibitor LprI family protein n=1 Tax=Burkholderia lata (strain ATCC 17760 / DSM 23089 / LMG 22485 / NCIMB 9086 / R18194 / 383) TaxID=482957 RepID=UPI001454359E|nr:lysozyme inhibitor LprI family protein [Burkholderia lata]VWM19654.1 PF07007 family protein [Burkholderia lata]
MTFRFEAPLRRTFLLVLLAYAPLAFAAGLDCAQASSQTEKAVCASNDLHLDDGRLSVFYRKLSDALPQGQRATLRTAQLGWLKTRDQCGADHGCLEQRYLTRIGDLQSRLATVLAYRPDAEDKAALDDLRALVDQARRTDSSSPVEQVIDRLRITNGVTRFSSDASDGQGPVLPTARPGGVTADEWRALKASPSGADDAAMGASNTLIDLDGDGQRDLVVESASNGTGLWSSVDVLRRKGGKFEVSGDSNEALDRSLYTTNGRGANQAGEWIRLRGRVYALYRDSHYGMDEFYLLRPFTVVGQVPKLTVHYRYRLSVPIEQRNEGKAGSTTLDGKLHAALEQALHDVSDSTARDAGSDTPLCPIPPSVQGDDRSEYSSYGPGHYAYEIVGDMAVHVGDTCYIGRLIDWFGDYRKDGLVAQLSMRLPRDESDREQTFSVNGIRTVTSIATSIEKMTVNSGN